MNKISLILLYSIFYLLYRSHICEKKHLNGSTPQNTACAIIMLLVMHNDSVNICSLVYTITVYLKR